MELIIDPELQSLIPPLSVEENELLEQGVVREGCREPLICWGTILIDGHHRHAICEANSLPYKTVSMRFEDRDAAKIWIIENQFGRRNISVMVRGELVLKLKPLLAAKAKSRMVAGKADPRLKSDEGRTDENLAEKAGIGKDTLRNVERIANSPVKELARMARSKEVSINAAAAVAKLPEKDQRRAVEGGAKGVKDAARGAREDAPAPSASKWPAKIQPAFADVAMFDEALNHLTQVSKIVNQLTGGNDARRGTASPLPGGIALANEYQRLTAAIRDVRSLITLNKPENVCPYCKAAKQKCESCRSTGWSTKYQWDTAPKKLKDEVAA